MDQKLAIDPLILIPSHRHIFLFIVRDLFLKIGFEELQQKIVG